MFDLRKNVFDTARALARAETRNGRRVIQSGDRYAKPSESRILVVKVKQKYDTVAVQLNKKPGKVDRGRYTLGDEVAELPCSAAYL